MRTVGLAVYHPERVTAERGIGKRESWGGQGVEKVSTDFQIHAFLELHALGDSEAQTMNAAGYQGARMQVRTAQDNQVFLAAQHGWQVNLSQLLRSLHESAQAKLQRNPVQRFAK